MYRELGSLDAFGVPGGPYTGAPRTFRWHRLPEQVTERLRRCLSGEELPGPLLRAAIARRRSRVQLLLAGAALTPLLIPLLGPRSWIMPWPLALLFVASFAAAGWLVQQAARRDKLRAGVYLFPLDVVEAGKESLRISPFGSLKNAGIRREGDAIFLELCFDHGARYRFACADEAAAERAYDKIKQAHAAVERVTFQRDLEETVDLDPFFALRGEPAWAAAALPPRRDAAAREALGPSLGMLAGLVLFAGCVAYADTQLYRSAFAENTEVSYARYLASGGRAHRAKAEAQLQVLRAQAAEHERASREQTGGGVPDWRHRADFELLPEHAALRQTQQQQAEDRYALAIAVAPRGPKPLWARDLHFAGLLARIFEAARTHGDDRLYFAFTRDALPERAPPELALALAARERRVLTAFARVLSDTVPADLLVVTRDDAEVPRVLAIRIHETIAYRSPTDFDVSFDVVPTANGEPLRAAFQLRMPAPAKPLEKLRPRSVFSIEETPGTRRRIDLLTARAFDRLYDEVYALFFPGDPKVPLADDSKTP